ncbi:hypothetical protein WQ57_07165 [Mesobacillus campisalis]|uniref:Uncharacterized protein n=2 Tax=Mesobacillus campisalis TaxID=1408103 RepID=A0A0M2SW06_9BACI|nr:hypothetical protein WQ57_07165 [Mesobacillus campisalis]
MKQSAEQEGSLAGMKNDRCDIKKGGKEMKRSLAVLCGSLLVLLLFLAPGSAVLAAEEPCECESLKPLQGAERNKIVAGLISGDVFKNVRAELLSQGFKWSGAGAIEVIKTEMPGFGPVTMVGAAFVNPDGKTERHVFINGAYAGPAPEGPHTH